MVRYAFTVRLFHSLQPAGLSRRFPRRTGMERVLSIRRSLRWIHYSKKTISVELILGEAESDLEKDFAHPPDGKRLLNQRPTTCLY